MGEGYYCPGMTDLQMKDVIETSDGGYAMWIRWSAGVALLRISTQGWILWSRYYGIQASSDIALGSGLIQINDRGFVIGFGKSASPKDFVVMKMDEYGTNNGSDIILSQV